MQERSARQDLECDKISLERQVRGSLGDRSQEVGGMTTEGIKRELTVEASCPSQNKDLKSRLASSESFQKPNTSLSQLESQNRELQERLQAEER